MATDWTIADGISDEIVALINRRMAEMRKDGGKVQPLQLLAGQLLGLMATFNTMPPPEVQPPELVLLQTVTKLCLASMQQ